MSSPPVPGPASPPGAARPSGSSPAARCRHCGARLRPEETWCSLCHQNVVDETPTVPEPRAEPDPSPESGPSPEPGADPAEPGADRAEPGADRAEPSAPRRPGAAVDPELESRADQMLAELAASVTAGGRQTHFGALRSSLGPYGGMILGLATGIALLACGLLGLTLLGLFV